MMTASHSDPSLPVWHLRLAYHGGAYCGWQIQPSGRTVQGELLDRLKKLFHDESLKIYATSRTDAGVHALDQHVSFTPNPARSRVERRPGALCHLLNRWLPPEIRVTAAALRPPGFHARYTAVAKAYTYVLDIGDNHSPFSSCLAWQYNRALNLSTIRQAAAELEGTHDFAGFSANPRRPVESTVRTIYRLSVIDRGTSLFFNVIGNGFLYKMVRSLVGYLVEVGQDPLWSPVQCRHILQSGRRTVKVRTAPPQGLFLARVFMSDQEWRDYQPLLPPYISGE